MGPKISIIIPAHNSASTIDETMQSVLNQTFKDWEAIIINDGSTDKTEEIICGYVKKDKRIRYAAQNKSGVSAARNNGIDKAVGDWLLFLDADDLIKAQMLEKMVIGSQLHPECDMIVCNWERLAVDGKTIEVKGPDWNTADAFSLFANTCVFCIHSCIVKKSAVIKAGKFDESLITCEDWDLWQRITRTGSKIFIVDDSLSVYRIRSASASNKGIQLFVDGLEVIRRGHSADGRVKKAAEKNINGASSDSLQNAIGSVFTWSAGLLFGSGDDPSKLFKYLPAKYKLNFDFAALAHEFFIATALPTGYSYEILEKLYNGQKEKLQCFIQRLEDITRAPELIKRSFNAFERSFFEEITFSGSKVLGNSLGVEIDITKKIEHIKTYSTVERVFIKVKAKEKEFGIIELPVINGFIHKYVIKDAIAENYAWHILGEFFKENIYKRLGPIRSIGLRIRTRQYKQNIPKNKKYFELLHNFIGWTIFLQETFNRRLWVSGRFYRSKRQLKYTPTIVRNNSPFTIEIGKEIPNIKLTKSDLTIVIVVGGNACRRIHISSEKKFLHAQEIRSIIIKELGYELCKIVVREVLLENELKNNLSLNERIKRKYQKTAEQFPCKKDNFSYYDLSCEIRKAAHDCEKGLIIPGRDSLFLDDSSARFAVLPIGSINGSAGYFYASAKENISLNNGTSGIIPDKADYEYIIYSPNVILDNSETQNVVKIKTKKEIIKSSPVPTNCNTRDLPVLMYHRIAPSGSDLMKRYRITPAEFENQLKYLQRDGYHSVTFEEWYTSVKLNTPLPGKAIILTFDDGYLDFYVYVYPLLSKYNFSAYVFIVTDYIGKTNMWDKKLYEEVPLMSRAQIIELNNKGIKFGSHSASHKPLTVLSPEQLACQFHNSINLVRDQLELHINSIAYPYGDYDSVVKHLAGAFGFNFGLTCEEGKCNKFSDLLALPRIEIIGTDTMETFISKINRIPIYPV
jgi:glycosyltransferase involved in cell wall biosynthesis/peptidoglycan/xylan/chitin deacetylase (PgdA/CDA1 family)